VRDNDGTKPLVLALAAALTLAACGGSSAGGSAQTQTQAQLEPASPATKPPAKKPDPYPKGTHKPSARTIAVITGWADTLRAGHVRKAATYFDTPVLVQNAGPLVTLKTRREVLAFNQTLPCGAHVVKTIAGRHYTVATFVLTERPGSPGCGATGQLAATAFVLRHGKIAEWRRVLVPPPLGDEQNLKQGAPAV
jgi:hypothetical protein